MMNEWRSIMSYFLLLTSISKTYTHLAANIDEYFMSNLINLCVNAMRQRPTKLAVLNDCPGMIDGLTSNEGIYLLTDFLCILISIHVFLYIVVLNEEVT